MQDEQDGVDFDGEETRLQEFASVKVDYSDSNDQGYQPPFYRFK